MLRLVIADDEVSIIRLIRNLISREIAHEIVGEATDGQSALAMIEKTKPDIVITDIRMPGLNGVELIRRAREQQIRAEFIIISGYKDFGYARDALRYGAVEYLLKPIKAEELNGALNAILEKQGEKERLDIRIQDMERTIEKNRREKRREVLAGFVRRSREKHPRPDERLIRALRECFTIREGIFGVLILKLDGEAGIEAELLLQNLEVLGDKYRREIQELCCDLETYCEQSRCYLWFHADKAHGPEILTRLDRLLGDNGSQYSLFHVRGAAGSMETDVNAVETAFVTADYEIMQRGGQDRLPNLLVYRGEMEQLADLPLSQEFRGRLERILYEFDSRAFDDLLLKVCRELERQCGTDFWRIRRYLDELAGYVLTRLKSRDQGDQEAVVRDLQSEVWRRADLCGLGPAFLECYTAFLAEQLLLEHKACREGIRRPIKCMEQYIREHFSEELSLDEIVGAAQLSNAYGSSIFKKETGMTITNYVIQVRMEEAKRLIRETSLTINEVAYRVGYSDPRYFSKLFIKVVGIKPVDYRRFYNG